MVQYLGTIKTRVGLRTHHSTTKPRSHIAFRVCTHRLSFLLHRSTSLPAHGDSGPLSNPSVRDEGYANNVHFGDARYQQFKDLIGHYSRLEHNDTKRLTLELIFKLSDPVFKCDRMTH
jgi:hypothetical protein